MVVSAQGRVVDFDTDQLYRAVAEVRLAASGNAPDPGSPSREEQLEALRIKCENSPVLGKQKLCSALVKLVAELPEQPLRVGDTWSGPNVTDIGIPVNMPTKCTLAAASDEVCTIEVEGQRGADEEPVVQEMDKLKISYAVSGTSQATLTVDRQTGWLLSKQQTMNLTGRIETRFVGQPELDNSNQVSVEITTTVTTLE
jgi:hypothetical protein